MNNLFAIFLFFFMSCVSSNETSSNSDNYNYYDSSNDSSNSNYSDNPNYTDKANYSDNGSYSENSNGDEEDQFEKQKNSNDYAYENLSQQNEINYDSYSDSLSKYENSFKNESSKSFDGNFEADQNLLWWIGADFQMSKSHLKIEMITHGSPKYSIHESINSLNNKEIIITYHNTSIRDRLNYPLNMSEFMSPVTYVRTQRNDNDHTARVILTLRDHVKPMIYSKDGDILLIFPIPQKYYGNSDIGSSPDQIAQVIRSNEDVFPTILTGSDKPADPSHLNNHLNDNRREYDDKNYVEYSNNNGEYYNNDKVGAKSNTQEEYDNNEEGEYYNNEQGEYYNNEQGEYDNNEKGGYYNNNQIEYYNLNTKKFQRPRINEPKVNKNNSLFTNTDGQLLSMNHKKIKDIEIVDVPYLLVAQSSFNNEIYNQYYSNREGQKTKVNSKNKNNTYENYNNNEKNSQVNNNSGNFYGNNPNYSNYYNEESKNKRNNAYYNYNNYYGENKKSQNSNKYSNYSNKNENLFDNNDGQNENNSDYIETNNTEYVGTDLSKVIQLDGVQPISIEFNAAPLKSVLRTLSIESGVNFIFPDNIGSGTVTLKFDNIPWDLALQAVLETNSLGLVKINDSLVRIDRFEVLVRDQETEEQSQKTTKRLMDTKVLIARLSFAQSSNLVSTINSMLASEIADDPRIKVVSEDRTNSLIIEAPPAIIDKVKSLIDSMDYQNPQVKIDTRIVEVLKSNNFDLGVSWASPLRTDQSRGLSIGNLVFPNQVYSAFSIDTGTGVGVSNTSAFDVHFGSINNLVELDLRIRSFETQNVLRSLQNNSVIVLDGNSATTTVGTTVMSSISTDGGVQNIATDYFMTVNVSPNITADGSVELDINVQNNSAVPSAKAQPDRSQRSVQTKLIRRSGQTAVIGGIYSSEQSESLQGLPILSKIPLLGVLFRKKVTTDLKRELMIMVTPTIVNNFRNETPEEEIFENNNYNNGNDSQYNVINQANEVDYYNNIEDFIESENFSN